MIDLAVRCERCEGVMILNRCVRTHLYSSHQRPFIRAMSETVQSYIDKHALQAKVEDALNACVKAKPEEPLTFMVDNCVWENYHAYSSRVFIGTQNH